MWSPSVFVLQLALIGLSACGRRDVGGLSAWANTHGQTVEAPWDNVKEDWSAWYDFGEKQTTLPSASVQSSQVIPAYQLKWRLCPADFQLPTNGFYNWENPYTGGKNIYQKLLHTKEYPLQKQGVPFSSHFKIPNKKMKTMIGRPNNYKNLHISNEN